MSIVCSGSVAYDYIMRFPGYFKDHLLPEHLEHVSLSFLVDDMVRLQGGIAPNICYSLALLGETPILFAAVGEDFEDYRRKLEAIGIDTRFARVIKGKNTASFFANTDLANAQIASFYTGAMANSADIKISELKEAGIETDIFLISPSDPNAMIGYARQCREQGVPFAFDPSQQIVRMTGEMILDGLEGASFLFCNEYEYQLLLTHSGLSEDELKDRVRCIIETLGENGSRILFDGKEIDIPVFPPKCIADPTGVGDAYRSGFFKGFFHGLPLEICGRMGSLASAYVLEQKGTQAHHYDLESFIARYRSEWDDQGELDKLL